MSVIQRRGPHRFAAGHRRSPGCSLAGPGAALVPKRPRTLIHPFRVRGWLRYSEVAGENSTQLRAAPPAIVVREAVVGGPYAHHMSYGNDPFGGDPFAGGGQHLPQGVYYGGPPVSGGGPGSGHSAGPGAPAGETNTLATLSVIFAFVFAPAGAALGHVALSQIKKHNQAGRRRAVLGTVISYTIIVATVVALVIWQVLGRGTPQTVSAPAEPPAVAPWGTPQRILSDAVWGLAPSMAVDADGNVYVASLGDIGRHENAQVWRYDVGTGSRETVPFPEGELLGSVAVDSSGNVYSCGFDSAWRLAKGAAGAEKIPFTLSDVTCLGVAADTAGDVYVAGERTDSTHPRVLKIDPSGRETVLPFTGLQGPSDVVVDASGNVYVLNNVGSGQRLQIVRLDAASGTQEDVDLTTGYSAGGFGMDAAGNLYIIGGRQKGTDIFVRDAATGTIKYHLDNMPSCGELGLDAADNIYCMDLDRNSPGIWKIPKL